MQQQQSKSGLTKRQKEYLDWIKEYLANNAGLAPSYEEIGNAMGSKTSATHAVVKAIINRGHLVKMDGHARSLSLPGER